MKKISLDISGNFHEGKGTTGVAIEVDDFINLSEISSKDYQSAEEYWDAHVELIQWLFPDQIIVEGYRLYHHKGQSASAQAKSILETPQLLGVVRITAYQFHIPLEIQYAAEVKTRWNEDLLVRKGYLEKKGNKYYYKGEITSPHKRDALKHLLHFNLKESKKK
jgi:hypothetical protein